MKGKRGFPLVDDKGFIKIEAVNTLPFDSLRNWIKEVLCNKDTGVGGDKNDLSHSQLKRVYHELDPKIREVFQDAVLFHLKNLSQDPHSEWLGEQGDELLLLVGSIFRDPPQSRAPIDLLLSMVKQKRFLSTKKMNLHRRALQTLVAICYRAHPQFWYEQYQIGGNEYAPIILAGLSLKSISSTFEWIKENATNETVITALFKRLPLMIEEYGGDKIASYLKELMPILPKTHTVELQKHADRLNLEIGNLGDEVFRSWRKNELIGLAKQLKLEIPRLLTSTRGLSKMIASQLRNYANKRFIFNKPTPDIEVIEGVLCILREKRLGLSPIYGKKFVAYMENIPVSIRRNMDPFEIDSSRYILMNSGRKPEEEIKKGYININESY
jgi:hypothetical protein